MFLVRDIKHHLRFQVSGVRCQENMMKTKNYLDVEDLVVYKKLCQLHIDVCDLTYQSESGAGRYQMNQTFMLQKMKCSHKVGPLMILERMLTPDT